MPLENNDAVIHILKCTSYLKKIITKTSEMKSTNKFLLNHMKWIAENLEPEVAQLCK